MRDNYETLHQGWRHIVQTIRKVEPYIIIVEITNTKLLAWIETYD